MGPVKLLKATIPASIFLLLLVPSSFVQPHTPDGFNKNDDLLEDADSPETDTDAFHVVRNY